MGKILNIEILGHPLNIIIVMLMIVLFWFAMFTIKQHASNNPAPVETN